MLSAIYDRDGTPLAVGEKWGSVVTTTIDLSDRRVGPYNLGAFHDMVQRHRPPVAGSMITGKRKTPADRVGVEPMQTEATGTSGVR